MMLKHCAGCGQAFQPRPRAPKQAFCSAAACQRIRKRQWQQSKRKRQASTVLNPAMN